MVMITGVAPDTTHSTINVPDWEWDTTDPFLHSSPGRVLALVAPEAPGGMTTMSPSVATTDPVSGPSVPFILQCRSRLLVDLLGQYLKNTFSTHPAPVSSAAPSLSTKAPFNIIEQRSQAAISFWRDRVALVSISTRPMIPVPALPRCSVLTCGEFVAS